MTITVNEMLYKIAERLRPMYYGEADDMGFDTPSTTTTLVDFSRTEPSNFFTGGTIFLLDAGMEALKITSYVLDSSHGSQAGTFTFAERDNIYTGPYAAVDKKYSRDVMMHALNIALSELGPFVQLDQTLTVELGAEEYILPAGVKNVLRVQIAETADGDTWDSPHRYWRERNGSLWFDDEYLPDVDGAPIRIFYEAPHARVDDGEDTITDAIHPDVIATLAAIHAVRMRLPSVGSSDPEPAQLLALLGPQYQALRLANPKRSMQRDSRYPVIPALEPTGGYTSRQREDDDDGGSSDTTAPSTPTGLTVVSTDAREVAIAWIDSSDNVAVAGYRIYRDGTAIGTVAVAAYTDTTVEASTTYVYEVTAYDAAGNESAKSSSVSATTSADLGDSEPPTAPSNLTVGVETTTTVPLTWTASTDNVGVDHYIVYRDGVAVAKVETNSYTDVDLVPNTAYTYTVTAVDAAGNESDASNSVVGTTTDLSPASTWFVSTNGSALSAGTEAAPWTLDHALNGAGGGNIGPGDIVYLRGGTYNITATQIVDGLVGTNTDHITIRNYPGERVVIRNAYSTYFDTFEIQDVEYTDFIGLEFTSYQYTRAAEKTDGPVDMYHIFENASHVQDNVRWLDCRFHDSPGSAMFLCQTSTNITVEGCLFYYNGSGTGDYTAIIHGGTGSNKVIRKNVFIHNSTDDIRLWSGSGAEVVEDINLLDNIILNTGGLWSNPARSILVGAETATPTDIVVDDNIIYNRQTADGNSRSYQVGNIGASTNGAVDTQIASSADDFTYDTDDGTFSTNNTLQVGNAGRSAGVRFINITIPQGATITSAYLTFNVTNTGAFDDTASMVIEADKSSVNPAAPTNYAEVAGRVRTTANVVWEVAAWAAGTIQSDDISTVVQEIVDQGTWTSGNAMIFYLEDSGDSTDDIWFTDRSNNSTLAARLHVSYQIVAADGGADTVTADGNVIVGQPVDLSGAGYTGVTFENNTVYYTGSHIGSTEADNPTNTWVSSYPSSGTQVYTKVYDHNNRRANLLILNWAGATSVTITDAQLGTLNLNAGDTYTLCNMENYYSDRITGIYNGTSITIPMSGRSQANTYGAVGNPTTIYPTVGIFQIIAVEGSGGSQLPPTIPTGLAGVDDGTTVNLSWNHSTGDVAGYTVYRDGAVIGTTATNSYSDQGLTPGQTYSYQVDAYNSVGVHSAPCDAVSVELEISGYFVSTTGSAANDGSLNSPWSLAFMLAGANGAIAPGDTIWVRGGTYSMSGTTYMNLDGTSSSPVSVRAYPNETPIIRISNNSSTALYVNNCQYTHFYDLVFTHTGYTRTNQRPQGTYEGAILGTTSGGTGVKFYGCHFKNAPTHGTRAFEHAGTIEYNGCIWTFNGSNEQYDHGVYCRNESDTPVIFRDCIMAHNAGHGFHAYQTSPRYGNEITLDGCLIFQNGSLYDEQTRQVLIGSTYAVNRDNTITENVIYTNLGVDGNADSFRLGYGKGHTGCTIARNYFVGSPVYLESGSGYDVNNNYLYYGSGSASQRAQTATIMNAGSNNTMAAIPSVGSVVRVRAYNWNSRRANIAVLNWAEAATVTVTHADLIAAGVTIANGEKYELHNAENYHGDVVTGTYNGSSITLPMTGRTVETPYGLPKPDSAFPKFGAFVLVTTP